MIYIQYSQFVENTGHPENICKSLKMEMHVREELCFPQFLNSSCKKPQSSWREFLLLQIMLSSLSLLTATLNLLVIISVSYFK